MAKDSHNSGDSPPPLRPHQRGQTKQPPTRSLLDWLWREEALTYLNDLTTPFDNNQGGHDLRMLRAQPTFFPDDRRRRYYSPQDVARIKKAVSQS